MLGIAGTEMSLAYICCILASLVCVVYGAVNWNNTGKSSEELREKMQWEKEERKTRETLP